MVEGTWGLIVVVNEVWGQKIRKKKVKKLHPMYEIPKRIFLHGALVVVGSFNLATMNQHPLIHHPLDACYDLVGDDPQLSHYRVSSW